MDQVEMPLVAESSLPPIAGFWRRTFAFMLDVFTLGLVAQILISPFSSFFYRIGPYGRFLSWPVVVIYFGLFAAGSRGQTWGQRMTGIAVRDAAGRTLSGRAAWIRAALLSLVVIYNGWAAPSILPFEVLGGVAVWLIVSTLYLMLFNRGTRQLPHDLATGSFVVYLQGTPRPQPPRMWRGHLAVIAFLFLLPLAAFWLPNLAFMSAWGTRLKPLVPLCDYWNQDPRVFSMGASDLQLFASGAKEKRILVLTVWRRGYPTREEARALENALGKSALEMVPDIQSYDAIETRVLAAVDIGLANRSMWWTDSKTVAEWRQQVHAEGSGQGPK